MLCRYIKYITSIFVRYMQNTYATIYSRVLGRKKKKNPTTSVCSGKKKRTSRFSPSRRSDTSGDGSRYADYWLMEGREYSPGALPRRRASKERARGEHGAPETSYNIQEHTSTQNAHKHRHTLVPRRRGAHAPNSITSHTTREDEGRWWTRLSRAKRD